MKHWLYPQNIVDASLDGLVASVPHLRLLPRARVVYRAPEDKVALISGGGSGHEPLHAGFVGSNLLNAAVCGSIFALPATTQILSAIRKVGKNGVVIIVKNYTGDILHFGLALERARAEGYDAEMVIVADDVAVGRSKNAMVGRRGIAGTALVHKILGSASGTVAEIAELGRAVSSALVTIGASLDRTSVPGMAPHEPLEAGKAELGLGIHNEPGEVVDIEPMDKFVSHLYELLLGNDPERHYVDFSNDDFVVLVNNIGGTLKLELYAITRYVLRQCPLGTPKRVYVSDFVTSLNSPGFLVTLLNLLKIERESPWKAAQILHFLDAPTNAPGWTPKEWDWGHFESGDEEEEEKEPDVTSLVRVDAADLKERIHRAMNNLIAKEPEITDYDTKVGDGDCGETLKSGAEAVLKLEIGPDPVKVLSEITHAVEHAMGGTSGGIYAIFFTALTANLQKHSLKTALKNSLDSLFAYTKARQGDRTLIDVLQPFVTTYYETESLERALEKAADGCKKTSDLESKFGRSLYVSTTKGVPDPGAVGLLAILQGLVH